MADHLGDGSTANALGADQSGGGGTTGEGHLQPLQVGFEFSPGDAGDFGADAAEIFLPIVASTEIVFIFSFFLLLRSRSNACSFAIC